MEALSYAPIEKYYTQLGLLSNCSFQDLHFSLSCASRFVDNLFGLEEEAGRDIRKTEGPY